VPRTHARDQEEHGHRPDNAETGDDRDVRGVGVLDIEVVAGVEHERGVEEHQAHHDDGPECVQCGQAAGGR